MAWRTVWLFLIGESSVSYDDTAAPSATLMVIIDDRWINVSSGVADDLRTSSNSVWSSLSAVPVNVTVVFSDLVDKMVFINTIRLIDIRNIKRVAVSTLDAGLDHFVFHSHRNIRVCRATIINRPQWRWIWFNLGRILFSQTSLSS